MPTFPEKHKFDLYVRLSWEPLVSLSVVLGQTVNVSLWIDAQPLLYTGDKRSQNEAHRLTGR